MVQSPKPHGAVVVPTDEGVAGLVQLLTFHALGKLEFDYYSHPYDIDVDVNFDFLMVLSVETFKGVVKYYDVKQHDLPLIVHIDTPYELATFDHARAFPGVEVLTIRRASLDDTSPDVTLELNLVGKINQYLKSVS